MLRGMGALRIVAILLLAAAAAVLPRGRRGGGKEPRRAGQSRRRRRQGGKRPARPESGQVAPWPWTVNADGVGHYFPTRDAAIGFVRDAQARGAPFIDVGCFQIDLFYHPGAFASLEEAFDPAPNADHAARFLSTLFERTGSWPEAVALYHSAEPVEGALYRDRVLAARDGGAVLPISSRQLDIVRVGAVRAAPAPTRDPFVVLMSSAARGIRVVVP